MVSASIFFFFFSLILHSAFSVISNGENSDWYTETKVLDKMKEKVSHLHFYFHDTITGKKPTSRQIAGPTNKGILGFGATNVADDPLTEGPKMTSKLIGRAQGIFGIASQEEPALLMPLIYSFVEGKYNGSTLTVLGRNAIFDAVREMPIVGGTGLFRFARGYAQAKTVWFNPKGDAVVEYNVFVVHY